MSWQPKQKGMFVRACTAVGICDDQRKMILSQCDQRAVHKGRFTSTSPKLTQADYEHCMAVVEGMGDGQIKVRDGRTGKLLYKPGHFARTDEAECRRLRHVARELAGQHFIDAGDNTPEECLTQWIDSHVKGGRCRTVDQLTADQLRDLLHGIKAWAKRQNIKPSCTPQQRMRDAQERHGLSLVSTQQKESLTGEFQPIPNNDIPF